MAIIEDGGGTLDPTLARWLGYGLSATGAGLGVLDLLRPSVWTVLGLLAVGVGVLLVALMTPESFETRVRGGGRTVNPLLGGPALGLFLVGMPAPMANPYWPLIPAAAGAAAGLLVGWTVKDRPKVANPAGVLIFTTGFCAAYAAFAAMAIDVRFDRAPAQTIVTNVLGKYETHGRSSSYNLQLPGWGPKLRPNTVTVNWRVYQQLQPGDPVCIALHPGWLGLAWFKPDLCGQSPPAA